MLAVLGSATAHEHKAPHSGTLVVFGEEFAHLEFVLNSREGKLNAYVLDGEAENPVRIKQEEIDLKISIGSLDRRKSKGEKLNFPLRLKAMANVLTGETEGDTSEFAGQSDHLKDVTNFDAVITGIAIKGKEFKNVAFNFPKGNEDRK